MKSHQKLKTALKRICLCLVTVEVAVGVSSNYIWPIAPLHWKGAHHNPRDAKHKGVYLNLSISGSINHDDLLTTSGSHLNAALKGLFYQFHSASTTISMKTPCVALAHCQTWLQLISFQHQESPDMVINHGLTDRALNCLEMKLHIPIQGSPGRTWNLFHLCVIKK